MMTFAFPPDPSIPSLVQPQPLPRERFSPLSSRPEEFHLRALPGRVEDWRAGFRSMFVFPVVSPFRLRVSQHLDHATFPVPATSNGPRIGARSPNACRKTCPEAVGEDAPRDYTS
jgi:hypothetical protein